MTIFRQGDYKLIKGWPGVYSGWYPPDKDYDPEVDQKEQDRYRREGLVTSRLYNLKGELVSSWVLASCQPHCHLRTNLRCKEHCLFGSVFTYVATCMYNMYSDINGNTKRSRIKGYTCGNGVNNIYIHLQQFFTPDMVWVVKNRRLIVAIKPPLSLPF